MDRKFMDLAIIRAKRAAEDGEVDVIRPEPPVHIFNIHAPYAVRVLFERAQLGDPAGVLQNMGETDVGRAVEQDFFSRRGEGNDLRRCFSP